MRRSAICGSTLLLLLGGACVAACGAEPAPVQPPPPPTAEPAPPPPPEPEVVADAGAGDGAAVAEEPAPSKPKSSGRPLIQYGPSDRISEPFGATPGAVLKLKAAGSKEPLVLKIPEWALPRGYQITVEGAKGAKGQEPVVGPIYKMTVQPQAKRDLVRVESGAEPFEFRVPTFGKDTVNLAVGEISVAAGKETVKWTVIAPRNVGKSMMDESLKIAYCYVGFIGHVYLHATEAAPTEAAKAE